jgi:hypothetical protein
MSGLPIVGIGSGRAGTATALAMDERERTARAALVVAGMDPCAYETCVHAATHDVAWRRTWPAGSYEATSSYCAVHTAELEAGARWANGDHRLVYLSVPQARAAAAPAQEAER